MVRCNRDHNLSAVNPAACSGEFNILPSQHHGVITTRLNLTYFVCIAFQHIRPHRYLPPCLEVFDHPADLGRLLDTFGLPKCIYLA